ncbi:MAG: IS5 family transposase [Treponema sp.]|nr:IS5 family transposase [Treponema sp.]
MNTKVHLALDKRRKPVRILLSAGQDADCAYAMRLIEGLPIRVLFADRGYDVNWVVETARARGIEVVIPPKRKRKEARRYDKALYKERHRIEHVFRWLKQWRDIATRYAKRSDSFLAASISDLSSLSFDDTP